MKDKLVVAVLGNRNSGKSHTWNCLFGKTVRTGSHMRRLYLTASEYVEVFLVSGSAEERHQVIEKILGRKTPTIVLCSMQYLPEVRDTIDYFVQHDYSLYVHWLNPGFRDTARQQDSLGLLSHLLDHDAVVAVRTGKGNVSERVQEIRDFIYGYAKSRNLLLR